MEIKNENIYQLEGRVPLKTAIPLGLQHVLAMYAGNLTPLLVVASVIGMKSGTLVSLLQNAMFISGLITLMQLYPVWKIGSGLPTVMGTSAGFIPAAISAGTSLGYGAVLAGTLIGGIVEFCLGFIIKPLRKILPNVVTGTVVVSLGISLISVGIQFIAGGVGQQDQEYFGSLKNMGIGLFVFLLIIVLRQVHNEVIKTSAILLGIGIGYVISIFFNMVDFSGVLEASWFSLPTPVFFLDDIHFIFDMEAIIPFVLVYLATTVETIGDNTGIAVGGLGRDATDDEIQGAVFADGFGSAFASLFGVMPNTSFSQNVGLISITKVVNKFTIMTGAVFLMLCSFFPKLGAIVASIPVPVLGGGVTLMFAMISMSGLELLYSDGKLTDRNMIIVAASLAVGFGLSGVPEVMRNFPPVIQTMFSQAIVGTFVTATLLNLILPQDKKEAK